jgi:hypothetical protein
MNTNLKEVQNDICRIIQFGVCSNAEIITTIECLTNYLNLISISEWAKKQGIDYTNAKYRIKRDKIEIIEIFGSKYVVDNE